MHRRRRAVAGPGVRRRRSRSWRGGSWRSGWGSCSRCARLGDEQVLEGLPELLIEGLAADDARLLLDAMIPGPLDEQVKARILDETRGNPLALMELPRGLTPAELAGGFGLPDARPLTSRIEQSFVQRVKALPRETQLLLLIAAAEPLGDVSLLWRAAERLGIGTEAGWPAEAAGLIELGVRVRFPHPLVRSAVYRGVGPERSPRRAPGARRRDGPRPRSRPSRLAPRACHDDAGRGGGRGDGALGRPCAGPGWAGRGRRVPAAGGRADAGPAQCGSSARSPRPRRSSTSPMPSSASALLAAAELGPLDELQRGRLERLRAEVVFHEPARARRAAAAARSGAAARSAGRRARPRDLPRGDRVGDVRRTPRHRPG